MVFPSRMAHARGVADRGYRRVEGLAIWLIRATSRLPRGNMRIAKTLTSLIPSLRHFPAQTRYGTVVCDLSEPVCYVLATLGEYPHWRCEEDALNRLPLNRSSVVLDIGANIGVTAIIFARKAGHVHAFEPSPKALAILRRNARENVTVHPIALGEEVGTIRFSECEDLDMSFVSADGFEVPMRTVDSLRLKPDLIKIDVEGYEPQVLKGAVKTLKRGPLIMFEALSEEALNECKAIILAANPDYTFADMGSGMNFLASVGDQAVTARRFHPSLDRVD